MTRPIANVMEDLYRQILLPTSISVLYGEHGVGKSRLLQQFVATRLQSKDTLLLNFLADGSYLHANNSFSQHDFAKHILQSLTPNSVLILDQFELAQSDLQRRILSFWSTSAKTRNLKLVVCGTQEVIDDLTSLSTQFSGNINSVELKPLSNPDREHYVALQVCRSYARAPIFPSHIKKLIRQSNGLYTHLDSICQQHSGRIECGRKAARFKFSRPAVAVAIVVSLVVITVVVNELYKDRSHTKSVAEKPIEATDSAQNTTQYQAVGSAQNLIQRMVVPASKQQVPIQQNDSLIESNRVQPEPQELKENSTNSAAGLEVRVTQEPTVLQQRLKATEHWLAHADDRSASLQVMTLSVKEQAVESLSAYLEKLKTAGIDLDNIYIYSAPKRNSRVYGVLYGSYSNRQQARQQLNAMPEILKLDRPIPRTVIGIKQEIEKNSLL